MEDENKILEYLSHPDRPIDLEWVLDMLDRYPAFYLPAAMYIKRKPRGIDSEMLRQLHTAIVLNCPDRAALADFADIAGADWANLYPRDTLKDECSTEQAISTFIDTYGKHNQVEDDELLERLIFTPVAPDYFSGTDEPYDPSDPLALPPELAPGYTDPAAAALAEEPEEMLPPEYVPAAPEVPAATEATSTEVPAATETPAQTPPPFEPPRRAGFQPAEWELPESPSTRPSEKAQAGSLPTQPAGSLPTRPSEKKPAEPVKPVNPVHDDTSLMESLAKYFIKQQRFERAYEIISKLNLNFPEKSVYFADQLRFLRKVIINRRVAKALAEGASK